MSARAAATAALLVFGTACADDAGGPSLPTSPELFVLGTDYETGAWALVDLDSMRALPDAGLVHADAAARYRDGRVYIVNRLGEDNLTALDVGDGFRTIYQVSTDPGSNPQDIAFASDEKAYVTRLDAATVLAVDPRDGSRIGEVDLAPLADSDGFAEPSGAIAAAGRIWVAVERLDRANRYLPTGPGALAAIDPATDSVERTVELAGSNPYGSPVEEADGRLLVAVVGTFEVIDGGIERVDPVAGVSLGLVATEEELGGDVTAMAVAPDGRIWAVVGSTTRTTAVVRFDPATDRVERFLEAPDFRHGCVAFVTDSRVGVCDRLRTAPGLRFLDAATGAELPGGPLSTGLPPSQIVRLQTSIGP